MKKLPNGHRFVKQDGYKKGFKSFSNWAVFTKDGTLLGMGSTKQKARSEALNR